MTKRLLLLGQLRGLLPQQELPRERQPEPKLGLRRGQLRERRPEPQLGQEPQGQPQIA
jgi:hypothetical protein